MAEIRFSKKHLLNVEESELEMCEAKGLLDGRASEVEPQDSEMVLV